MPSWTLSHPASSPACRPGPRRYLPGPTPEPARSLSATTPRPAGGGPLLAPRPTDLTASLRRHGSAFATRCSHGPFPSCTQAIPPHQATLLSFRASRPSQPRFKSPLRFGPATTLRQAALGAPAVPDPTALPRRHGAASASWRSNFAAISMSPPAQDGPHAPGSDRIGPGARTDPYPGRAAAPSRAAVLPGHATDPARFLLPRFGPAATSCPTTLGTPPPPVDGSHRLPSRHDAAFATRRSTGNSAVIYTSAPPPARQARPLRCP